MKKKIAMVVLVVLLLGGANALVDNKIEKNGKGTYTSRREIEI